MCFSQTKIAFLVSNENLHKGTFHKKVIGFLKQNTKGLGQTNFLATSNNSCWLY